VFHEYRRYECMPGKLPALRDLMANLAVPIFNRVGMKLIAAWEPIAGEVEATVIYVLAFDSLEDRERKWKAFYDDAEWKAKRGEIAKKEGGPIVAKITNMFLTPASYSPIK